MNYFNDIEFVICGHATGTSYGAHNRVFQDYYGIQYIHNGCLDISVDGSPTEHLTKSGVFITYPGASFSYVSPPGTSRDHVYICFRGERVKRYIDSGLLELRKKNLFQAITAPDDFLHQCVKLVQYATSPSLQHHVKAVLLLEELLFLLHEQPNISDKLYTKYSSELEQLRDNVIRKPLTPWDFYSEASRIGLSYPYFCRLFKEITGCPPGAFHLACRLNHATHLLASTSQRIQEISQTCGFNDAYHFSRMFKKHTKMSPSDFRKHYSSLPRHEDE